MRKQPLNSLNHCVFRLTYHLVFVTKHRRKAITPEMLNRLEEIFRDTLTRWECTLIEFNGEPDHVHLLLEASPLIQLSKLVNNLKTVSSRLIRRDFRTHCERIFYRKPIFWHRSYGIFSTGGPSIDTIRQYIANQGTDDKEE